MSYKVSAESTFDDITKEEAELLYSDIEALHKGSQSEHLDSVFESWCQCTEAPPSLLVLSTVFTIKALLSLVRHYRFAYAPIQDDMERINCNKVGMVGHQQCGICKEHNQPRFRCGCLAKRS